MGVRSMTKIKLIDIYRMITESECHNNPRKAVKEHPDYNNVIDKISKMKYNDIGIFLENWILKNESGFADVVVGKDERYVDCDHATEMVSQILDDAGISHTLQVGIITGQSHAWVKIGNIIIDPTKDQFGELSFSDYQNSVNWSQDR